MYRLGLYALVYRRGVLSAWRWRERFEVLAFASGPMAAVRAVHHEGVAAFAWRCEE